MLKFNLTVTNPFSNKYNFKQRDYNGSLLVPHKHWELVLFKDTEIVSMVEVEAAIKGDHAPRLSVWLALLGYGFSFTIYDDRHDASDSWGVGA